MSQIFPQVYCLLCVVSQYQEYKAGRGSARSQNNLGTRVSLGPDGLTEDKSQITICFAIFYLFLGTISLEVFDTYRHGRQRIHIETRKKHEKIDRWTTQSTVRNAQRAKMQVSGFRGNYGTLTTSIIIIIIPFAPRPLSPWSRPYRFRSNEQSASESTASDERIEKACPIPRQFQWCRAGDILRWRFKWHRLGHSRHRNAAQRYRRLILETRRKKVKKMKIAENSCKLLISAKRNKMNGKWCHVRFFCFLIVSLNDSDAGWRLLWSRADGRPQMGNIFSSKIKLNNPFKQCTWAWYWAGSNGGGCVRHRRRCTRNTKPRKLIYTKYGIKRA